MKRNYLKLILFLSILIINHVKAQVDDFAYRPYPIILVHGFSSSPEGTWGAQTKKEKDEDKIISTAMDEAGTYNHNNETAKKLIESFKGLPDWKQNKGFFESRMLPFEEINSYKEINNTFVETYCSYYRYESNDAVGIRYNKFGVDVDGNGIIDEAIDGPEDAYDITNGGQTQLLRIRVIQVLNEYYGDFKWVNDPSAKVRIVCHSNGVVVVTNFLKNEENDEIKLNNGTKVKGWYNDGNNGQGCHWSKIKEEGEKYYTSDGKEYKIDGIGFKLRDHVDFVAAFNGPFAGTPLANKDGNPTLSQQHYSMVINSAGHIYCGMYKGGILCSTDNGSSWNLVNSGLPDSVSVYSLALDSKGYLYAGTYEEGIYRSTQSTVNFRRENPRFLW